MVTTHLSRAIQTIRRAAFPREEAGRSDGQLLESYIRSREELAFAALVHRHGPMVIGQGACVQEGKGKKRETIVPIVDNRYNAESGVSFPFLFRRCNMNSSQEDYERGQKDGSQADAMDRWCHDLGRSYQSDEYNAGYENGRENPASNDDDE